MAKKFLNFINGRFIPPQTGEFFDNINPANKKEILGRFPRSGKKDADVAVDSAKKAQAIWQATSPPKRGQIIFKVAELMAQRKEEIADIIVKEMGKTKKEALGDVQSGIEMAYFCAGEGRRLYGQTTTSEHQNKLAMTRRVPVGVCALITPWNFPMATISWKVFPALICGNAVVLKPAEDTPWTANILAEILQEVGVPAGVLNLVHGIGEETGDALVRHPNIDLISFTGSTEVGRQINEICAERLIKVSLEMGGKNAVLALEDADIDSLVKAVAIGAFTMAGQRCAGTSRLIVHKKIYNKVLNKLVRTAKALKVGPGSDKITDICPVISEKQLKRIANYVEIGKKEGAKLILGGKILKGKIYDKGFYFPATIFVDVKPNMTIAREEIFGPVLSILECDSSEQGVDILNSAPYGLTCSIFTQDVNKAMEFLDRVEVGVCYINAPTFGSEVHLPFGGFKQSGSGHREAGMGAIDVFSEWKTIYIDYNK